MEKLTKITMTSLRITREYDNVYHLVDLFESTEPSLLKEFESMADKKFLELNVKAGRKYITITAYSNIYNYSEFCDILNKGIEKILKHNIIMLKTGYTAVVKFCEIL